eukprot:gene3034-15425_t
MKRVKSGVDLLKQEAEAVATLECLSPAAIDRLKKEPPTTNAEPPSTIVAVQQAPAWAAAARAVPSSISPTVFSIVGLLCLLAGTWEVAMCDSALLAASAEFKDHKEYSMFAVSAMLYMCFDGIAGAMAAQRPPGGKGTDSALNARLNLLTRSCTNAIASSLLVVGMAMSLQMQPTATWVVVMFGLVTVYIAQWQEYVTGKNIPPKRWARAEALLVAITIPLFTGITGTAVWQTALLGGWCINHVVALVFVAQAMGVILQNWDRIAEGGPGDSGTTPAGTGCLSPATPLLFGIWSTYQLLYSGTFARMPGATLVGVGLLMAKVTMKLLMGHMTKSAIRKTDSIFIPIVYVYLDSYVGIGRGANYLLGLGIGEELIVYCGILFFLGSCIHYGGKCAVEFSKATNGNAAGGGASTKKED